VLNNPVPLSRPTNDLGTQAITQCVHTWCQGRLCRCEVVDPPGVPDDVDVPTPEIVVFGDQVAGVLAGLLGDDLVGVYFVGSVALGGYVTGESDADIAAVSRSKLSEGQKRSVAGALVDVSAVCPARGVEFTLYRRDVVRSAPTGADFEVNANGGPRMPTAVHVDATSEEGFWYVLDRAIAHRSGVVITGPPPRTVFADVPRRSLLEAMSASMAWHRAHEKATFYSVLNACRAWRFAEDDVLGSKLEGARWARTRWPDTDVIDAALALRRGEQAALDESAVDALLAAAATHLREAGQE
jgi:Domain of unknown function (DUF4111)